MSDSEGTTRREVFKKAAFVTPIILTFPAIASFARAGSNQNNQGQNNQGGNNNRQN
jgi:hypothetical protein